LCVPLLKRVEEIQTKEARSLKQREKERERERESRERECIVKKLKYYKRFLFYILEAREKFLPQRKESFIIISQRHHVCAEKQHERHGFSIVGVLENERKQQHQLQTRTLEETVWQE
jgi:hypothetical protein